MTAKMGPTYTISHHLGGCLWHFKNNIAYKLQNIYAHKLKISKIYLYAHTRSGSQKAEAAGCRGMAGVRVTKYGPQTMKCYSVFEMEIPEQKWALRTR